MSVAQDGQGLELRDAVREVLRREAPALLRDAASGEGWRERWSLATSLGWPAIGVPEELGGLGLGLDVQAAVVEEAGYALFSAPLLSTALATALLVRLHGAEAAESALAEIAEGAVATLVFPDGAVWDGERLCGSCCHVLEGDRAELIVVAAAEAVLIARPGRGVLVEDGPGLDSGRPLRTLTFDAPDAEVAAHSPRAGLDAARTLLAAELVGLGQRALDVAVAHAREREQFGRPIGAFQGVKHRLADLFVAIECARSLVGDAAAALDSSAAPDEHDASVAMAQAAASQAARSSVKGAIQVTGALGITAEHDLPWLLRRVRQLAQLSGDVERHHRSIGRAWRRAPRAAARGAAAEYAAWLTAELPPGYAERAGELRRDPELRRRHQAAAFEAGWLVPQWPPELGGRSLGRLDSVAVRLEGARRQAPKPPSVQSVGVVAPALERYATPAQRERFLVPTLRGELTWALGMSEPGAGSDLAALRTRAVLRGDRYVVSGQKVWSTQAHTSDHILLFCRTDPEAARHRGISCLLVDLDTPGIAVREIEVGWPDTDEFCEVFLDDVEVPAERLLGDPGAGWAVAMTALNHERDMIWVDNFADIERGIARVASAAGIDARPEVLAQLGRAARDAQALRLTGMRALQSSLSGRPSPEFHVLKLLGSETLQRVWELALAVAGPEGLDDAELLLEDFEALGATIYGGTSEIQRNIIGERVLGLPRDR